MEGGNGDGHNGGSGFSLKHIASLPRITIASDINVIGDYAESAVYTDQKYQTPILYARWDKGVHSRKLTFSFHVVRQEVVRRDLPKKEAAWDPADFKSYLTPTSLGPHQSSSKRSGG